MVEDTEEKLQQLQLLEQNLQNFLMQKQNFQSRLLENENALREVHETKKQTYKILGSIMVAVEKDQLRKDLDSEKEILDLRIKSIEKQENKLKDRAQELQKEILKELK